MNKPIKTLNDLHKLADSKGKDVKYLYVCGDGTATYRIVGERPKYTFDKTDIFVRMEK
jgi:hypothetical protein